jgi:hypothetical protein
MKQKSVVALGLMLICIIGVLLAPSLLKLSLISPGWEIYDQIGALGYQSQVLSSASQFTNPRDLMGVYSCNWYFLFSLIVTVLQPM